MVRPRPGPELKEQHGGSVTTITVGEADCDPVIRKALAIGADDAVRIDANPQDALHTASLIANHAKQGGYDVVLCGKETIDHNGSVVGGMVAEMLDAAYISLATSLDLDGGKAHAKREASGGLESIEATLPVVVSGERHGGATHPQHARNHGCAHEAVECGVS